MNAAATAALPSGRGYVPRAVAYLLAYAIPATFVWGALALLVHPLHAVAEAMALIGCVYALVFGLCEALAVPIRPLSLRWQVPAQWLQGRSVLAQTLIWGTVLGPGLITWNPYAGMWFLLIVLTWNRDPLDAMVFGACIGLVHGMTRALAILYAHRNPDMCGIGFGLTQWRWRVADGCILLGAAGGCMALALQVLFHVAG